MSPAPYTFIEQGQRRQAQILKAIRQSIHITGRSPTIRELCDLVGLRSSATVAKHLRALEADGLIRRPVRGRTHLELVE